MARCLCIDVPLPISQYGQAITHDIVDFDVTVAGTICWADGIGRQSIELIDCLKNELVINFVNTRAEHEINLNDVPEDVKKIIINRKKGYSNVVILEDGLSDANQREEDYYYKKMLPGTIKLAYSMFESTCIQDEWVTILNEHFDAVVVPDSFLINVYKNSGVTIPIFMIPLGGYMHELLAQPNKTSAHTPFTFGFTGTFEDRKNHIMILESFAKAFGNSSDVRLILHGRTDRGIVRKLAARVKELGLTNVEIQCESFTHNGWIAFMHSLDCYVSFSKGEGFSRSPREAMALGIPCILSNSTAQKTICDSGYVRTVVASVELPAYYDNWKKVIGNNFDIALNDAVQALKDVYEHYSYYLKKAAEGRIWVQQYLYENLQPYYLNIIKPKKVILGDHDEVTVDYIMTMSQKLYEKYNSFPIIPLERSYHE